MTCISTTPIISARDVSVSYPLPRGVRIAHRRTFDAVCRVSLDIWVGDRIGIVGESGSGKSTLGRALAGLQPISRGELDLKRRPLAKLKRQERMVLHRQVQFIFQDPFSSLNPRMSTERTIGRVLKLHTSLSKSERRARVRQLLNDVGLSASFATRYPYQMSGGQRQRISIARALAAEPEVLIADEPTSSLDVSIQAQILHLVQRIIAERQLTLVFITHDFGVVRAVADRVAVMHLGEIVEVGAVESVIHDPRHPYTRALLSAVPSPTRPEAERIQLAGRPLSTVSPPSGCRLHPRCPYAQQTCADLEPALKSVGEERMVACHFSDANGPPWSRTPGGQPVASRE